jgi:antitoxin PrlF
METANEIASRTSGHETRITSQGQVSVPAPIRKMLGVEPGNTLVWIQRGDEVVVKKRGASTTLDVHKALFPGGPPQKRTLEELKQGIEAYIRENHARG